MKKTAQGRVRNYNKPTNVTLMCSSTCN